MENTNLKEVWAKLYDTDVKPDSKVQRLVYLNMLYRVYIGIKGFPRHNYIIIEIPENRRAEFTGFKEPQGINLCIDYFGNEKPGFVSVEISSALSDVNDIFEIVAQDILVDLSKCRNEDEYIQSLKDTISRWKHFFSNKPKTVVSGSEAVGLFGELSLVKDLFDSGITIAENIWNGSLKTAQDFQLEKVAVEVKSTKANKIDEVNITSLEQLDLGKRDHLFITAYRLELNKVEGITIPELVNDIKQYIPPEDLNSFMFKLSVRGFNEDNADQYEERYSVAEKEVYEISEGFPYLTKNNIPTGIKEAEYTISLSDCKDYKSSYEAIIKTLVE